MSARFEVSETLPATCAGVLAAVVCLVGCVKDGAGRSRAQKEARSLIRAIHETRHTQASLDRVEHLLAQGTKVNVQARCRTNHWHTTPLIEAIRVRDEAMVELLLGRGAQVDLINPRHASRWTALHHAIKTGQFYVIEALLKRGAKLDVVGRRGQTPLHVAAGSDKPGVVELLLKKGAKVNPLDKRRRTPLDLANYQSIRALLIQAGGKRGRAFVEAPSRPR